MGEYVDLYDENNLYACFIEMLTYAILYNKQPIYNHNIEIDIKDNVGTLHDKLSEIGAKLLIDTLPSIFNETNKRI